MKNLENKLLSFLFFSFWWSEGNKMVYCITLQWFRQSNYILQFNIIVKKEKQEKETIYFWFNNFMTRKAVQFIEFLMNITIHSQIKWSQNWYVLNRHNTKTLVASVGFVETHTKAINHIKFPENMLLELLVVAILNQDRWRFIFLFFFYNQHFF